jgi:hypothetical protein
MYFVFTDENKTKKPVEIIFRRGGGRWGRMMEGVNLINIYWKHICKCHYVSPVYNYYMLLKEENILQSRLYHMIPVFNI